MVTQYKLTVCPSCSGYGELETSPVVLAAQLALDVANLVGGGSVYSKNPILVGAIKQLESALEKSREIGGYLDGNENAFLGAAASYARAIQDQQNNQNKYTNLLDTLHRMSPIKEVSI
ncbi:hypothetical protein [Halopseudomonas pelagia]|uniref:hypothetical protein n=1 Tax=Halopseudomonas pelagia TaxID=553151 RepID=UPI00126840C3|nr:hypothetical protein [Halopseudomonas pelagia]